MAGGMGTEAGTAASGRGVVRALRRPRASCDTSGNAGGILEMVRELILRAGVGAGGFPIEDEVLAEPLDGSRYRLVKSPGVAQGLAADDELELHDDGTYQVVRRSGNLCIQIFFLEGAARIAGEAARHLEPLGGRLDGMTKQGLVYTVPVAAGFPAVERALGELTVQFPLMEWYYGNVYDPADGVTPLNWW
jgi:hypothetical protein